MCVIRVVKDLHRRDDEQHQRVHTADKPHECKTCPTRFTQSCSLIKHVIRLNDLNICVNDTDRRPHSHIYNYNEYYP